MKTEELKELTGQMGFGQHATWTVGQTVIVRNHGSLSDQRVTTITRITSGRGGTIYVGDLAYDSRGHQRGSDTWGGSSLYPATPEAVKEIKSAKARKLLAGFPWSKLSDDDILKLWEEVKAKSLSRVKPS